MSTIYLTSELSKGGLTVFMLLAFYKARFCFLSGVKLVHICPKYAKHTLIKE